MVSTTLPLTDNVLCDGLIFLNRAMLHDENIYPQPFEFNPDRWIKDGKLDPDMRDPMHAAFGFGRRYVNVNFFDVMSSYHILCSQGMSGTVHGLFSCLDHVGFYDRCI